MMRVAGWVSWWSGWLMLTVSMIGNSSPRISSFRRFSRRVGLTMILLAILPAASYAIRVMPLARDGTAVLIADEIAIRSGDGNEFDVIENVESAEGDLVQVINQRRDWTEIEMPAGVRGWIPSVSLQPI